MGIFIHLSVSRSVTKDDWDKVYRETLPLVEAFQLSESRKIKCRDIDVFCMVPTKEREEIYGWHNEKIRTGWWASGDYQTMREAETYYLPRDLICEYGESRRNPEANSNTASPLGENRVSGTEDAMLSALPAYLSYDFKDPLVNNSFELWGAKTQGEPYHLCLLAIACLIEARLGRRAFIYGDITRGQCNKAVEMANKFLRDPIRVPDRCDEERLYLRVSDLPLTPAEKIRVFENFYLGVKNSKFGAFLREHYAGETLTEYWGERFSHQNISTVGFSGLVNQYLTWGFDLEKLCALIPFDEEKDKAEQCEKFIKCILDTKLYVQEKDCTDPLSIDQESSHPYGVWTLLAQFALMGARNKNAERYIPIDEVKKSLMQGMSRHMAPEVIRDIIDHYLQEETGKSEVKISSDMSEKEFQRAVEANPSAVLKQTLDEKRKEFQEQQEQYDIVDYEDLLYFKKGDTMRPGMTKALKESFIFCERILQEDTYKELLKETAKKRCEWLVEENRYLLLRDKDWERIFKNIEEREEAFARYYPMVRVNFSNDQLLLMGKAMVVNDDLYEYCKEAAEFCPDR